MAPVIAGSSSRPTENNSRSSSYGQSFVGAGLTPGVPKWDQTPSPIFALSSEAQAANEDRPVAPGAEITVASVRRHVKQRINAAKDACDKAMDDVPQDYFEKIGDSPFMDTEDSENESGGKVDNGLRSRAGEQN